jgi:glycosyltransferase involved in cell wall biosynthesis
MHKPRFSVIVPVYNRPNEVKELLESLVSQTFKDFEVLLIEDGSSISSEKIYEQFTDKLHITYFFKPNSGPGPSRNFGFEKAQGDYFIIFDSDCILPSDYFDAVVKEMSVEKIDAWGGPDKGMKDFTPLQQAMAFTMSSVLTTGGIRGKNKKGFQPRSFNMGFSREVYEKTQGFKFDRYAEDIELSVRIKKLGFKTALIKDAFVYHKRRTTLKEFFKQVSNFGMGRVQVSRVHPGEIKPTHWFPTFFLIGLLSIPLLFVISLKMTKVMIIFYALYITSVFVDCLITTRSLRVSLLSIPSLLVQMIGYGWGFLRAQVVG